MDLFRCPSCGHYNPPGRENCYLCKKSLDIDLEVHSAQSAKNIKLPLILFGITAVVLIAFLVYISMRGGKGKAGAPGEAPKSDEGAPKLVKVEPDRGATVGVHPVTVKGEADMALKSVTINTYPVASVQGTKFMGAANIIAEGEVKTTIVLTGEDGKVRTEEIVWNAVKVPSGTHLVGKDDKGRMEYKALLDQSHLLIQIPEGTFEMGTADGDADEKPPHKVKISTFVLSKTEVTNAQFKAFCDQTGRPAPKDPGFGGDYANYYETKGDFPVVNVNYGDAYDYCTWLGTNFGGFRLPTEAEWEYAARGTTGSKFPWGNDDPATGDPRASMKGEADGYKFTAPVGKFPAGASPFGFLDLAGNVWEWVSDYYSDKYYGEVPADAADPQGPQAGKERVCRGGSFVNDGNDLSTVNRWKNTPSTSKNNIGFRCAKNF